MTPYRRNVLVGITILAALGFLGWMMIRFGATLGSLFAKPTIPVQFVAPHAEGLSDGSPVQYQGVSVGRVMSVERSDNLKDVIIHAQVEPPLPQNVIGKIVAQSLLGAGSGINLELTSPDPQGRLEAGTMIQAKYIGNNLLPPEIADLAPQIARLANELELTARQFRESGVVDNLNQQVLRLGEVLDSMNQIIGDEQMQADLRQSLQNIRTATASANRVTENLETFTGDLQELTVEARSTIQTTGQNVDDLTRQTSARIEQLAAILQEINAITTKINQGQGTAGLLVNDPRLYENLVETSRELDATVSDLRRLVEQWEQEGVSLRLTR